MKTLLQFSLAFSLAACANQSNELIPDPCIEDPFLPECVQEGTPCADDSDCEPLDDGECLDGVCKDQQCVAQNICEAQASAEAVVFMNNNGSAFFGSRYDDSAAFDQFIAAETAELAGIPVGSCAETEFPDIEGDPSRKSMGNVKVLRDGEVLADVAPSGTDDPQNEAILDPGTVSPGDVLDIELAGSPAVLANTFLALLTLPPAFPVIAGVDANTNTLTLTTTMAFTPITVDHVVFRFNFLEGQKSVTITCVGDGDSGSFTFDSATFARLPQSGSLSMAAFNRAFRFIATPDGVARSIRGTAQATTNVSYQKP